MYTAARQTTYLASSAGVAWAVVVGVVIVGVLVGAFWWGSRRASHRRMPPPAPQPGADSWHRPDPAETAHSARAEQERSDRSEQ